MKAVYRYPLEFAGQQEIPLPLESEILCVKVRGERSFAYVLADLGKETEPRIFVMVSDDKPLESPQYVRYLSSVSLLGDQMFHWFVWEGLRA